MNIKKIFEYFNLKLEICKMHQGSLYSYVLKHGKWKLKAKCYQKGKKTFLFGRKKNQEKNLKWIE